MTVQIGRLPSNKRFFTGGMLIYTKAKRVYVGPPPKVQNSGPRGPGLCLSQHGMGHCRASSS